MNYFIGALKKYAVFSGRSTRSEFWYFQLFALIISIALGIADTFFGSSVTVANGDRIGILGVIFSLTTLVPSIALSVRRLHDTNKSGLWMLLIVAPFLGLLGGGAVGTMIFGALTVVAGVVLFIFFVTNSTPGDNKYGPNPKNNTAEEKTDSFISSESNNPPSAPQSPDSSVV